MSPQRYVVWREPGTGCQSCGRGHNWFVVDRVTDTASSVSFDEEDDAADLADFMNEAYACGVSAVGVNLNLPSGHSFRDEDGDGLCDYVTDFSATERRCLKLEFEHSPSQRSNGSQDTPSEGA